MKKLMLAAATLSLALSASPALAAGNQSGLVNVNVTDIELLKNVGIAVPVDVTVANVIVQAPIGIAAQVCGITANVIAQQGQSALTDCKVTQASTSEAFNNLLKKNKTDIEQQLGS